MEFVSIDKWTIIMQWCNLFVLYLIVRWLLFKPINKILNQRDEEIKEYICNINKMLDDIEDFAERTV